jgi:MFS family permease
MRKNKTLWIIGLIAVVNALGYGIIIPILYSYTQKFGLSDFQNGLLFALFSLCQFISTPIIGRLSDKFGRKPLLLISLAGTAVSFVMMAFAPSALFLFIARAVGVESNGRHEIKSNANAFRSDKDNGQKFTVIG